ncbi:MAG: metallophosphoesterase family protein [Planctomycetota bacterium]
MIRAPRSVARRVFLAGALALVTIALPLRAGGTAPQVDRHRFALLADTHIDANAARAARGIKMTDHLAQAVREVLAAEPRPAGVLLAGDIAFNRGRKGDYEQFAESIRPLVQAKLPLHLLLGNHDSRENLFAVIEPEREAPHKHAAVIRTPNANWFLLDSLDKTNQTAGRLGPQQLAWLADALDEQAGKPVIVVAHHPLDPAGQKRGKTSALLDSQELLDVLVPRKHVKAFLHGHAHVWARRVTDGMHIVSLPAVAYTFSKAQPSAWVLAEVREEGMVLELRCLDPNHKLHGQKVALTWRR